MSKVKTQKGHPEDDDQRPEQNQTDEVKVNPSLVRAVLDSYFKMKPKPANFHKATAREVTPGKWRINVYTQTPTAGCVIATESMSASDLVKVDDKGNITEVVPACSAGSHYGHGKISDPNKRGGKWN